MKIKDFAKIKYGKNQKNVIDNEGIYPIIRTGGIFGYASDYLYNKPSVYLAIIDGIFSGKYLSITALISFAPMLYLINVIALKNISTIAKAYTAPENVLLTKNIAKNNNTTTTNASIITPTLSNVF